MGAGSRGHPSLCPQLTISHRTRESLEGALGRDGAARRTWSTRASGCFLTDPAVVISRAFPGGSVVKNPPATARDAGSIPGLGRFPWRRKWLPIPVFWPGKSHGQRSLVDYTPRSRNESDMTATEQQQLG